jgi:hypothetical protein
MMNSKSLLSSTHCPYNSERLSSCAISPLDATQLALGLSLVPLNPLEIVVADREFQPHILVYPVASACTSCRQCEVPGSDLA